jgi:hypothetical protein
MMAVVLRSIPIEHRIMRRALCGRALAGGHLTLPSDKAAPDALVNDLRGQ